MDFLRRLSVNNTELTDNFLAFDDINSFVDAELDCETEPDTDTECELSEHDFDFATPDNTTDEDNTTDIE